ncbi:MAG: class I SAM-dependent methyltransferase [Pseudomonadota bacterium]
MITVDFSRLNLGPGSRILDMGCGSGRHTAEAARNENALAVGADLNFSDLREAQKRMEYHVALGETGGGPWAFLTADVTRLPYQDNCFDLVICSEVLEHVPDHQKAVRELVRVLKPGQNLVVSVPARLPEKICWLLSDDYYNSNGGHIRIYNEGELVCLLEECGVRKWAAHRAHALHSPYWWLKCLVGPTRNNSRLVKWYHDFLVWDMMKKPKVTRTLDRWLNPVLGKSLVLYLKKEA